MSQDITGSFRKFASWCDGRSRLYRECCEAVIEDEKLRQTVKGLDTDRRPYLFFAAIHYLLMEEQDHGLADFCPGIGSGNLDAGERDPVPAFRDFCLEHRDSIRELAERREVQTNEVRRCTALLPGFELIRNRLGRKFSMVEIGSSAGLNLLWDRYRYSYRGHGETGPQDSELTLETDLREGEPELPGSMPEIRERKGIDLNPLDVTDSDDTRWLKALTWPEQVERRERLERAVEAAKSQPPDIVEGDALEKLPGLVEELPGPVVVYGTQVLWELPPGKVERFTRVLSQVAERHEIHALFGERGGLDWLTGDRSVEDVPVRLEWSPDPSEGFRQLGSYGVHGEWLRWRN